MSVYDVPDTLPRLPLCPNGVGPAGGGPAEALRRRAILRVDTGAEAPVVEVLGREVADGRVHAVLRLEEVRLHPGVNEALEEAELHAFRLAARARRGPDGREGVRRKIPNDALPGMPVPGAALFQC